MIISENKSVLDAPMLNAGIRRLIRDYPVLNNFNLTSDFTIEHTLPDTVESVQDLSAFLESIYNFLRSFIGAIGAKDRIEPVVHQFMHDHSSDIKQLDLNRYLPKFLLESEGKLDLNDLRTRSEKEQIILIFQTLFTDYLKDALNKPDLRIYQQKAEMLVNEKPAVKKFQISDAGNVVLDIKGKKTRELVETFSDIFNTFVELASFTLGSYNAQNNAKKITMKSLNEFEELPEKSGITNIILRGSLAKRIRTGVEGFDSLIQEISMIWKS